MPRSAYEYLRHMQDEAQFILKASHGLSRQQFVADEILKRAFVRSIEVIGEAAKNVPQDFRDQHPEISWRQITGMRDHLIHGYVSIDYEIVWDVIVKRVAELNVLLHEILKQAEPPPGDSIPK